MYENKYLPSFKTAEKGNARCFYKLQLILFRMWMISVKNN